MSCDGNHFCFAFDFGYELGQMALEADCRENEHSTYKFSGCSLSWRPGQCRLKAQVPAAWLGLLQEFQSSTSFSTDCSSVLKKNDGHLSVWQVEGRFATMQISVAQAPPHVGCISAVVHICMFSLLSSLTLCSLERITRSAAPPSSYSTCDNSKWVWWPLILLTGWFANVNLSEIGKF